MSDKQTVADAKEEESKTASSEDGAQEESLDDILRQFDDDEDPKPEPKETESGTRSDDVQEVLEFTRAMQAQQTEADIDKAVETIQANLDEGVNIGKRALRNMLNGAAGEDKRLQAAWVSRHRNPAAYEKTLKALARDWSKDLQPVDRSATEVREAVTNAVRGASKQTVPEAEDYSKVAHMSDTEFEQWKREQARKMGF